MTSEPIKITDLKTLKLEKQRLKLYCSYQEDIVKNKITSLKSNYKQIIGEQFLPFDKEKNSKVSNIIDIANEFIFEKFLRFDFSGKNKLAGSLIKTAEVGIVGLFKSFVKKK